MEYFLDHLTIADLHYGAFLGLTNVYRNLKYIEQTSFRRNITLIMIDSSLAVNPLFRIQVLFENEPGKPTKEFKARDLSGPSFHALAARMLQMTFPNEDPTSTTQRSSIGSRKGTRVAGSTLKTLKG